MSHNESVGHLFAMLDANIDWVKTISVATSFAFMWLGVFMLIKRAMRRRRQQPQLIEEQAPLLKNSEGETIEDIAVKVAASAKRSAESQRQVRLKNQRLEAVQKLFQGVQSKPLNADELFGGPADNELSEDWADDMTTEPIARDIIPPIQKKSRRPYLPLQPKRNTSSVQILAVT